MAEKTPEKKMDRNRELNFDRRMTDQEALMWNIEKDPWMNPNGSALTILDRPVDFDLMVKKIRYGLTRIPRLRERPVPGLGRLSPPVWATDPDFDLMYHLRHVALLSTLWTIGVDYIVADAMRAAGPALDYDFSSGAPAGI